MRAEYIFISLLFLWAITFWGCSEDATNPTPHNNPELSQYSVGDSCLGWSSRGPEWDDTTVVITVEGCGINLAHTPYFNCCMDSATVDFEFSGDSLKIIETEYTSVPCDCICPFDITADLTVPGNGTYLLQIYYQYGLSPTPGEPVLKWEKEVVVAGCPPERK